VKPQKQLGIFALAMLTVAAIISLRNLPLAAEYGLASITYSVVAALVFFIPIALVTAELATGWAQAGGNYNWVSQAFGKKIGFFALWSAWMESIAWFPAILAFTAAMLAHVLQPWFIGLEESKWFCLAVMLSVFWGATFLNFLGIEFSSTITSLGVICGTLIPGSLIIGLGLWWILSGQPLQFEVSYQALFPEWNWNHMALFSGILLGLAGVELAVFHINEARNPQKDYPKALLLAVIVILVLSLVGTLAIAAVVPQERLSLTSGLMQAFAIFFGNFDIHWGVPFLAFLALLGSLAGINAWTVGPAKGLLVTAQDGFLPAWLKRVNKKQVPTALLIFQATIGTLLSGVFLLVDDHSAAFWVLTALSAQFTVVQYILVFISALKLRYSHPHIKRSFKVPGGKFGIWLVTLVGLMACIFGFVIVFLPPLQLKTGDQSQYRLLLATAFIVLSLPPLVLSYWRDRKQKISG